MNVHYLIDTQGHADSVVVPLELWRRILDSLEKSPGILISSRRDSRATVAFGAR